MKTLTTFAILILLFTGTIISQVTVNQTDAKGKKQGLWRKDYPDGTIRYEGSFKDDQPDGIFRYYNELGKLKMVCFYYDKGRKSRAKGFDIEGNIISSGNYFGKEKDSVWTYYDAAKNPIARESWNKGVKKSNGESKTRFKKGNETWNTRPLGDEHVDNDGYIRVKVAETGKTCILIKHELLRNEYNDRRTQEQILADIRKRFHKCECMYDFTVMGQTNVRISWEKKV
jgi:hypothetical protein